MAGHIYDPGPVAAWKIKVGKAQINGNPSSLLFLPAVCISSGQCFNQRGFSVINMPRCSYDYLLPLPYS